MKGNVNKSGYKIWFGSREIWVIITLLLLAGLNVAGYLLIQAKHGPSPSIGALQDVHDQLRSGMTYLLLIDIIVISVGILALTRGCSANCLLLPDIIEGMPRPKPLSKFGSVEIGSREIWIALSAFLLISLNMTAYNLFLQQQFSAQSLSLFGIDLNIQKYAIPILLVEAGLFAAAIASLGRGCSAFCTHVRQYRKNADATPLTKP